MKYSIAGSSFIITEVCETVTSDLTSPSYSYEQSKLKRSPKIKRQWIFGKKFTIHNEAMTFVNSENIWSTATTNNLAQGKKVLYRCKRAKQKGQQCEAGVSLLFCIGNDEVLLHRAQNQHICQLNCSHRNASPVGWMDFVNVKRSRHNW